MNEAAAGEVLLLRAYEQTRYAPWTDADRAWASRAALQAVGADAPADTFLAARAQLGLQKLAPQDALLARWRAARPWRREALLGVVVLALLLGLLVDRIGGDQRINLLAPPVWALIGWNLAVYAWLAWRALLARDKPGPLRSALAGLLQRRRQRRIARQAGASVQAWQRFGADWAASSLPLNTARLALALHLGSAALALGVLAGLYLRGLVLDYRVGWESTFLDAGTVSSVLSALLAPAVALSGIALPDVAGFEALRTPPGAAAAAASSSGSTAAPWIHLYALQLLLLVLLPRLALALWAGLRARRLRRRFVLPLDEPYFQRLRGQQRGHVVPVRVWPHAHTPDAAAQVALGRLFARVFGDGVLLRVAPTVAYGAEDQPPGLGNDSTLRVALFDLAATPEAESQGRLLEALSPSDTAPALVLVDEAGFVRRFGAGSSRLDARRQAWRDLAAASGSTVLFLNLRDTDLDEAEAGLQAAMAALAPQGVAL